MTVGLSRPSETHESRRMAQLSKKRIVTRPTGSSSQEATVHTDIRPIVERINTNPIIDKADLTRLLHDLLTPLEACQSPGGARIKLGHSGAGFDHIAAELEGFARALWGLAPLLASEPHHPLFRSLRTKWVTGLINGTDPASSEYWGDCHDRDQRMVDQAAISVSIAIAPSVFWRPLSSTQQAHVNDWLLQGNSLAYPASNWRYFKIINNIAMKLVGGRHSREIVEQELNVVEQFVGPFGLPADGVQPDTTAYDYYTTFAVQYYSLLLARVLEHDYPLTADRYRQRAMLTAPLFAHLFAADGAAIPFGRSMTYRFACSAFWAAVAYDGLELPFPFTWGVVKGLLLRNIRSFSRQPAVFDRDGALTIGWTFPTLFISENYSSPQSPYWALKSFLVLALPTSHVFWQSLEEAYPSKLLENAYTVGEAWSQVYSHAAGHTFLLTAGLLPNRPQRADAAKYGKFAYSSAFGFSVPTGSFGLEQLCPDSTLAVSDDEGLKWHYSFHMATLASVVSHRSLKTVSVDQLADVEITTWLKPPSAVDEPFHSRVHKITTSRNLSTCEGGFAISCSSTSAIRGTPIDVRSVPDDNCTAQGRYTGERSAYVRSSAGLSGLIGVYGCRQGKVLDLDSNSNLMAARTLLPTLQGTAQLGTTWCAALVFAVPESATNDTEWAARWEEESALAIHSVQELMDGLD